MSALTRKLILLLVVCITAIGAAAQTRTLSGEVVEKSGDPLVGVSVFNREYKIGTTTDIDGKFEITLPSGVKKLTFSYIGFQPLEIDLKPDENKITVTMTEDAQALDEVVVVGYGPKEATPNNEPTFKVVDEMPKFPGGQEGLMRYLAKNIKYPTMAQQNKEQGKVLVQIVIGKDGNVSNIKILKGASAWLDAEAIRVVRGMPKWEPGKQNGQAVAVEYTFPITFRLQ